MPTPHNPPEPKRRGRPSTGEAMTPAQRKALQRERDRVQRPVHEQTLEAVLSAAGSAVRGGDLLSLQAAVAELQRRAKIEAKG